MMVSLKKSLRLILLVGLLLRLVLSAITIHPDIVHFDLASYVLGKGNIANFYDYTFNLDKNDQFLKSHPVELFNYPPAVYFSVGFINWVLTSWEDQVFHQDFLLNFQQTLGKTQLLFHLILLKLPYLPFDIGIAFLLYGIFKQTKYKTLAFSLWIFNPLAIYSTYMIGQFDVIPTFFSVLALYLVSTSNKGFGRITLAALALGVGISFKIYPVLFLIPLSYLIKNWPKRLLIITLGLLPYLLTIIPFLGSSGFRTTALVANQTLKSLYTQIPVSGGEAIILFLLAIGFLYLVFFYEDFSYEKLWQKFLVILLPFFIFTHYHPQWLLWLTPFLIIELINTDFKHLFVVVLMFTAYLGGVFLFEASLSIGLFSAIIPSLFQINDIWSIIGINIDRNLMKSLFHTLFVSCSFYFIYRYFPRKGV